MSSERSEWTPGVVLPAASLSPEAVATLLDTLTPAHVVALTAWGEARSRFDVDTHTWVGNPIDALHDVMQVIDNRARRGDNDHKAVCLAPFQFSCWLPSDPDDEDHYAVLTHAQLLLTGERIDHKLFAALRDAELMLSGQPPWVPSFPGDTCHYHADWIVPPAWTQGHMPVARRYGHVFYAGIA